jgi:predicted PolB exonuclease-like 3'-5' exonuclease
LDTLAFDIETIPQQEPLTTIQQEELDKQLEKTFSKNVDWTEEEKEKYRKLIMATNPFYGEIICIGLYRTTNDGVMFDSKALVGKEKTILTSFWKILESFKGVFISFNGLGFDVPFILKRSMKYGIIPTNNDFLDMKRFSRKPHFDVKLVMGDWDKYAFGTLRLMCDYLGIISPKEGTVKAENVEDEFKKGNIDLIAEYCMKDVEATHAMYDKIQPYQYQYQNNKYNQY